MLCYGNSNIAVVAIFWLRLITAARLYRRFAPTGPILDFGAATGELYQLLETDQPYDFCERNDDLAGALIANNPGARRVELADTTPASYSAVFALDSLEHNDDYEALLDRLAGCLKDKGILVISGPTENLLYRIGRRILGSRDNPYHKTTLPRIEQAAASRLQLIRRRTVPFGVPLFRISVWRR